MHEVVSIRNTIVVGCTPIVMKSREVAEKASVFEVSKQASTVAQSCLLEFG